MAALATGPVVGPVASDAIMVIVSIKELQMAVLVRKLVVYEHAELTPSDIGMTFGEQVDAQILRSLETGERVEEIRVDFADGEWDRMQRMHHQNAADVVHTKKVR